MTCDHVRLVLATEPVPAWTSVQPHLEHCAECTALAALLRDRTNALESELEDFANAPSFDAAFAAASTPTAAPQPARGARTMFDSTIHIGLLAAAASAAIGLGLYANTPTSPSSTPATPPIEATTTTTACGDLDAFEADAMLGKLEPGAIACLERRVDEEQHVDSLRLLTVDAFSRNDEELWEERAEHLASLTPEDPDLNYKLALHFSKKGPEFAEKVIDYAEAAQENRTAWTGDTYTTRVNNLMKLRAVGAMTLWQAAPEDSDARDRTARFAREWLDYTRAAGLDSDTAEKVCLASAGPEACAD